MFSSSGPAGQWLVFFFIIVLWALHAGGILIFPRRAIWLALSPSWKHFPVRFFYVSVPFPTGAFKQKKTSTDTSTHLKKISICGASLLTHNFESKAYELWKADSLQTHNFLLHIANHPHGHQHQQQHMHIFWSYSHASLDRPTKIFGVFHLQLPIYT